MQTNRLRIPLFFLSLSLLSFGFESDSSVSTQEPGEVPLTASKSTPNTFGQPPEMTDAEREKSNALFDQSANTAERFAEVGITFHNIASKASGWEEAHQEMREQLQQTENTPVPHYLREQAAAQSMFRTFFINWEDSLGTDQRKAVGFYTELLVENRSPESPFVLSGLEMLEGHWPDEKMIKYARIARQSATDTYGSANQPKTSSSAEEGSTPGLEAAKRQRARTALEANEELKRMAQRLSE